MKITNLHQFLRTYFTAHHCEFTHDDNGVLTVQLTEKMDRVLMNRPFYWHYIKVTGSNGDPMQLTLITNPEKRNTKGDWIHFGSPRLQQIISHLKQSKNYVKLFEKINTTVNTALYPWLIINIKISYQGKQNKDELYSIGLNLVNGMMKLDMMKLLQSRQLNMTISDYCYPISPIIKLQSGYNRIETIIENYINNQTHHWADESVRTLDEEVRMVEHFYNNQVETDQRDKEIKEIKNRYTPVITYKVINGGIIYLISD